MGTARAVAAEPDTIKNMAGAENPKWTVFPSELRRYTDEVTEGTVYRFTDPANASFLPAHYNRAITRNSAWMLFCCDRTGIPQAYLMNLRNGESRQLTTAAEGLDGYSLTLSPDDRRFFYFAGRDLYSGEVATPRERKLYETPSGWERLSGMSVSPDGSQTLFAERQGSHARLRSIGTGGGSARTVIETDFPIADPITRTGKKQILYREIAAWPEGGAAPGSPPAAGLWVVNFDGGQNRRLKLAGGRIGPATWGPTGTVLYLLFPEDRTKLNALRECAPDANTDQLVASTSQYVHFGFNRNASVFAGASRNLASPDLVLMLRVTGREMDLCAHRSSRPELVAPVFAPDAQRIYFQSDRDGKPAIFCVTVERLVERIQEGE